MKRCIIVPDSFKGTLSAIKVCKIIEKQIRIYFPECEIISIPIADGGEGTVDSFLYTSQAKKIDVTSSDPYGEKLDTYYARINDMAIIEMASTAGLTLVEGKMNPYKTTTYGVGVLIRHAIKAGCKKIIIGLGGSCTNDGGVGMSTALGTKFFNKEGKEFIPSSNEFGKITAIDNSITENLVKDCKIIAMCDIRNPLCGKEGAAYIFAPQKGADKKMVKVLDDNLYALSEIIYKELHVKVKELPGSGAAGGMGAGIVAFLKGELNSGIDTILDFVGFDQLIEGSDLIFTGEGKIDSQSLNGKAVIGVAKRAQKKKIPVVAIVGTIGEGAEGVYEKGIQSVFSINCAPMPFEEARKYSEQNLEKTIDSILRFYKAVKKEE